MSKRIKLNIPGIRLNESGYLILEFVAARARALWGLACRPVMLSNAEIGEYAGITKGSIMRAVHELERSGMVVSYKNTCESGARLPNSYALTALGIEVLRLAQEAMDGRDLARERALTLQQILDEEER